MKNCRKRFKKWFTRLLTRFNIVDLDACVAKKVKDSDMFFITYLHEDRVIDLWNFKKGFEEEFAATLALYFSEGKAGDIVMSSAGLTGEGSGDAELLLKKYLEMVERVSDISKEMDEEDNLVTIGNEPPFVSPTNMFRPHAIAEKK